MILEHGDHITHLLEYYMGKNTQERQEFIINNLKVELDNYLHKHPASADALKKRIEQSERERKDLAGIKKLANERAKKANLHNRRLRDCKVHLNDEPPAKGKEAFFCTAKRVNHIYYGR